MSTHLEDEIDEEFDDEAPIAMGGKPRMDDEIDMTPMIDVTFLLLIFFVVTSDMNPEKAADLPDARNGGVIALNDAALVQVKPGAGDVPEVVIGDNRTLSAAPEAMEQELADFLRAEMDRGRTSVVVQADGNATTGQVANIRKIISETLQELEKIHIAIVEKK